jgi:NAD(P)-dependent dehydrogenase (short-subunit alcohol dehydrogenase family)
MTRVAVITGGASGIGAAIADRLADDGLTIVVADIDAATAVTKVAELAHRGAQAFAVRVDVGDAASIAAAFDEIDRVAGGCDVLVNSAGVAKTFPFLDYPLADFERTMTINVTGTLLCSQQAARRMRARGWGRIVTIASVAGLRAVGHGRTGYGTSKAAVIGLTRQMAVELAEHGITANAVCPGPVDTPMTRVLHSDAFRAQYTGAIPMARYGATAEIAATVAFLASDGAGYLTGVALPVDGGFMAAGAPPPRG